MKRLIAYIGFEILLAGKNSLCINIEMQLWGSNIVSSTLLSVHSRFLFFFVLIFSFICFCNFVAKSVMVIF